MSELITRHTSRADFRWQLLATASALALCATASITTTAKADEADRPTVWIELGGQLERVDGTNGRFIEPFMLKAPLPAILSAASPIDAQHSPRYGKGGEASILFTPTGTDWVFTAALRYGRSNANRTIYENTPGESFSYVDWHDGKTKDRIPVLQNYSNNRVRISESHAILDFAVGKDVGLGMFGRGGASTVDVGIRFAQFTSKTDAAIRARPDVTGKQVGALKYEYKFHNYNLSAHSARSFRGIGPSLDWKGSAPFAGDPDAAEFTFDWGVNAAVLFGRQKATVNHDITADVYDKATNHVTAAGGKTHYNQLYHRSGNKPRSRSVVVPNVGGFAGMSLKFPNA
ncbi:MAG TPA: hypothetical protein VL026_13325, partial [Rhizomicrobium sp.]|nr:hypothetical protein [Rhizomicrobium sp.]